MRPAILLALLLLAGCSALDERWAEATFTGLSYPSLYGVVVSSVDAQGFPVRERDPQSGEVHSDWVYGTSRSVVRGPSRRRVHANLDPAGADAFRVRLRVEEQVVRQGGLLATNVRESDNWEPFEDDFDEAEFLLAKIAALLSAHRSRETAP